MNISPITVMCGTNSCGKSTILQSILSLKQTFESKDPNQTLLLNGRFVHLGSLENIIFEKSSKNQLEFDIRFSMARESGDYTRLGYIFPEIVQTQSHLTKRLILQFKVKLKTSTSTVRSGLVKPSIVDLIEFNLLTHGDVSKVHGNFSLQYVEDDKYILNSQGLISSWANEAVQFKDKEVRVAFVNLSPLSVAPIGKESEGTLTDVNFTLYRLRDVLQRYFGQITYIGPLREEPSRRYIYEDEIVEIGSKGENAAYIFLAEQTKRIENHFFYNAVSDRFERPKKGMYLDDAVNSWLDLLNIKKFKAEPIGEIIRLNLDAASSPTRVSIADVGFGVSQVFPIILEGLRMNAGSTLLLEQPEIHLHPKVQMQMADYFISLALSGKRLIIETHSDHIINRLVRRIVEDKEYDLGSLVSIYFIEARKDEGSVYEKVKIDEKRGILNWPRDFFDQNAIEQEKIIKAGLDKRLSS